MIDPKHQQEWLNSAVDQSIIDLNVRSLSSNQAWDYLFYSDAIDRLNSGRVSSAWLKKYQFLDLSGGWWCNGVDPLNRYKEMMWGCYKPNRPRLDFEKKKPIKYEHPPKTPTRAFFLRVSYSIGLKIAQKAGVEAPYLEHMLESDGYCDNEEFLQQEDKYFWLFVENNPRIDITIVEGAKKAASLLSHGYAAIGIPGINGAVRTYRDGVRLAFPELIPELEPFTFFDAKVGQAARNFILCFDNDRKRQTRQNINREISKLGHALEDLKCSVAVLTWSSPEKGVDDFIIAHGENKLDAIYAQAYSFGFWKVSRHYALTYTPSLRINQRYLGAVPFPESGLAFIKSQKCTGKTESLGPLIQEASDIGRKVLLPTHRIQLGRALCGRLGLEYLDEVHSSDTQGLLGYGLCVDSLHPLSKARFKPEEWVGAVVVIDEIEQVLWHMLNSGTCQSDRIAILDTFTQLVQTVLSTGGLIVGQDADLSDVSID
ncbi:MAG TPA: DUF3854 domain-containing protein, partial [Candidatus Obscuribacterales bacterium]